MSSTLSSPSLPGTGGGARPPDLQRRGTLAAALGWLIIGYQKLMSGRPSPCRYIPSCSEYALEALEVHGACKGSWLAGRRLCRCHPWGRGGLDPVPPRSGVRADAAGTPAAGPDAGPTVRKAQ